MRAGGASDSQTRASWQIPRSRLPHGIQSDTTMAFLGTEYVYRVYALLVLLFVQYICSIVNIVFIATNSTTRHAE